MGAPVLQRAYGRAFYAAEAGGARFCSPALAETPSITESSRTTVPAEFLGSY